MLISIARAWLLARVAAASHPDQVARRLLDAVPNTRDARALVRGLVSVLRHVGHVMDLKALAHTCLLTCLTLLR